MIKISYMSQIGAPGSIMASAVLAAFGVKEESP